MRVLVRCAALLLAAASPVAAQSAIGVGTSAGVVKLTDQRSEEALSGVLEYQPNAWLSLYAIPAVLHLSDNVNGRPVSSSGLGDLPLVVAASYASPTPGSPPVGAALLAVLPTGNAACGHGLTAASPRWILSVGVGTAFGGSSPVTPTTPLRRLKSTFNSGNTAKIGCR